MLCPDFLHNDSIPISIKITEKQYEELEAIVEENILRIFVRTTLLNMQYEYLL